MNSFYIVRMLLAACLFSCVSSKNNSMVTAAVSTDVAALQKLEYDWLSAEFKLDTAAIAAMMDDGFISVNTTGIANKQQELDGIYRHISQRSKDGHVVDSLYLDDIRVQVYDNAAVVTFISVTRGRIKDIPFNNRRTRFYDTWIKRNGQWKAVSSQGTPLP